VFDQESLDRALWLGEARRRIRRAEDLQASFVAAADLFEEALNSDLDREVVARFEDVARRIAAEAARLEPAYAAAMKGVLSSQIAMSIAVEVMKAQHQTERFSQVDKILTLDLVDVDPEVVEQMVSQLSHDEDEPR